MPQGAMNSVSSADVSSNSGTKYADAVGTEILSVALIGPDEEKRSAVAKALAETRRAKVREFASYPPGHEHLQKLLSSFEVIIIDLDSDPAVAHQLVEKASAVHEGTIMVYYEKADPKVAFRMMRAGASEFLTLPLEKGAVAEALARAAAAIREKSMPVEEGPGKLLVFTGSKGGSGVTTVASNVAIALAQEPQQKILLVDLALPIGDVALCLGIAAEYSTEDALRNIDRLDENSLQDLLARHRSGVCVLAAPTKVPDIEVSKEAIDKLITIARNTFDHVIVDVGSRVDVAAKAIFEVASTIYLVTQTGISELRNSNRLISQFFTAGDPNLEIVINRVEPRYLDAANDDIITKALGRPVRWKIPDDQSAARALQHGGARLAEARISRISLEMAGAITGRSVPKEKKKDADHKGPGKSTAYAEAVSHEHPGAADPSPADAGGPVTVTWPPLEPISYGDKLGAVQLNATASTAGSFVYTPGAGYVLPVGTHTLWVTFTPSEHDGEAPVQAANSIVVAKGTPAIFWQVPAEITPGTALGDAQLNATASVPGRFEYSPSHGETLSPGVHTLSVAFTPDDSAKYNTAEACVSINVARATAAIEWPKPASIVYGTQLSAAQLNATASVAGSFEYSPNHGETLPAGEHKLSLVFTPADSEGYSQSHVTVPLTVTKATPSITWHAPESMTYGAQLSGAQLNATASVAGSFEYSPAHGAMLAAGKHRLSVVFTPADHFDHSTAKASIELLVEKATPSIEWRAPDPIVSGSALTATQLNATATVPGSFSYTPAAGEILEPGEHELSVRFIPTDTLNYTTERAGVSLSVHEKQPVYIEWDDPSAISYGVELSATQLNATASVPGTFVYAPSAGHILAPGRYTLTASFIPSDSDKFAPAQSTVMLEVHGVAETAIAAPSYEPEPEPEHEHATASVDTQYTWTYTSVNSNSAEPAPAPVSHAYSAVEESPRETRKYKGVVYEKGEDGQWHIQKK